MGLGIHETKEQVLANAYHLYPSHKYHNIILGTNGTLLPVRQYHAYVVAHICADLHCNASQHCSATSSMLITGHNSDTIEGAYSNLLDTMMGRCWKGQGQPHGDVQHIAGHGEQENHDIFVNNGLSGSGTAATPTGGVFGSAQRTASSIGSSGSDQASAGRALFRSGQGLQSTVGPFPTPNLKQSVQSKGVKTNDVQSSVTQHNGIHNHHGGDSHRPPPSGGLSSNNWHAIGDVKDPHAIHGCEMVDCKVCLYLNGTQSAASDDLLGPRVHGQGVSDDGLKSSTGFSFGTAARKSMDSSKVGTAAKPTGGLKTSTGVTFSIAPKFTHSLRTSTGITFGTTAKKSMDNHETSTGVTFGTTTKKSTNGPNPSPGFTFGTAEKKSMDGPKTSTGIVFGSGGKTSTQDRFVAGQVSNGSGRLCPNDASSEFSVPLFQNIQVSTGSRHLSNSVLNKRDASDKFWRAGRRFE